MSAQRPKDARPPAACAPTATRRATAGTVRMSTPDVRVGGSAEGSFDLGLGADRLEGRFSATFCEPPEMEPRGCRP